MRNSKGFLQIYKTLTLVEQGNVHLKRVLQITEFYRIIPLNFSFIQVYAVLDTLPPLLLTCVHVPVITCMKVKMIGNLKS